MFPEGIFDRSVFLETSQTFNIPGYGFMYWMKSLSWYLPLQYYPITEFRRSFSSNFQSVHNIDFPFIQSAQKVSFVNFSEDLLIRSADHVFVDIQHYICRFCHFREGRLVLLVGCMLLCWSISRRGILWGTQSACFITQKKMGFWRGRVRMWMSNMWRRRGRRESDWSESYGIKRSSVYRAVIILLFCEFLCLFHYRIQWYLLWMGELSAWFTSNGSLFRCLKSVDAAGSISVEWDGV